MGGRRPAGSERALGMLRLVHPFPSLLDGAVTAGLALVAGAAGPDAFRAGAAMVALQFAIGAANDLADAPADARAAPSKPIPAGLVTPTAAGRLATVAAIGGLSLAVPGGPAALAVAAAGLADGLAYDFRLKGTAWSWLPYALGLPLLLVFAWVGAGRPLPPAIVVLAPIAALAGAQLAVANALADVDRDRRAGVTTVATRLGPRAAGRLVLFQSAIAVAAAWLSLVAVGGGGPGLVVVAVGCLLVVAGAGIGIFADGPARRRAWEIQAIGLALIVLGWTAAVGPGIRGSAG